MKKFVSVSLALVMGLLCLVSSPLPASAYEVQKPITSGRIQLDEKNSGKGVLIGTVEKNEYDMYLELQNRSSSDLLHDGYTEEEISIIRNISFEELLYERALLPEKQLEAMGYSPEQIKDLKNYDGSPIESNPELRGLFAEVDGKFYVSNYGTSEMGLRFDWSWSNTPVFKGTAISDIVTVAFSGTNQNNLPCVLTTSKNDCECFVYYYRVDDGSYVDDIEYKVDVVDIHQHVEIKFPMGIVTYPEGNCWAKGGHITVNVAEEAPANQLYSTTFSIGYGHTVIGLSVTGPSITLSLTGTITGGIGLVFGKSTEKMVYNQVVVKNDGTYHIYEGG